MNIVLQASIAKAKHKSEVLSNLIENGDKIMESIVGKEVLIDEKMHEASEIEKV